MSRSLVIRRDAHPAEAYAERADRSGSRRLQRPSALRSRDQLADSLLVAVAQHGDRVWFAADDFLEELLAVLVCRQRALGPSANVVEQHGQPRVSLAELAFDLPLHALRQRG